MSAFPRRAALLASSATALVLALPAGAALVPAGCLGEASTGSCGLRELVGVFVLIANYIFGISGSLAFAFFVYGGFTWLASGGSSEKITKGKTIVTNAVIGLIIIFGAQAGVNFALQAVTVGGSEAPVEGASCKDDNSPPPAPGSPVQPRWMTVGGSLTCISTCDELREETKEKYSCGKPIADRTKCVSKLCEGGSDNICCIR